MTYPSPLRLLKCTPRTLLLSGISQSRPARRHTLPKSGYAQLRALQHHWYDLVISLGPYRNSNFELPELGISLAYNPGTVIGLSGKMLEHAVPCFDRERVCYTFFMNNVHEWAGVDGGTWMKTDYYASDDCA